MRTSGQRFYSDSALGTFTRQDVLNGQVIKINPALITITDGWVNKVAPERLQQQVEEQVRQLLAYKIQTFHVDVNFEDYNGYGVSRPDLNVAIFAPPFLQTLSCLVHERGGYLNLHLLTGCPRRHFLEYEAVGADAICFQLDALPNGDVLAELIDHIQRSGACASPVIETVGSENLTARSQESGLALLKPLLSRIGMLTFQVAGTASRSNVPTDKLAFEQARSYITVMRRVFTGTIQLQGGITTQTIGDAVRLGAEFLVCGTEIFRNREERTAHVVIDDLLQRAATALVGPDEK